MTYLSVHHAVAVLTSGTLICVDELKLYKRTKVSVGKLKTVLRDSSKRFATLGGAQPDTAEKAGFEQTLRMPACHRCWNQKTIPFLSKAPIIEKYS